MLYVFNIIYRPFSYFLAEKILMSIFYQITPFKSVKIRFDSVVDWHVNSNIIRANANFHYKPRYDYVLVKADTNGQGYYMFAQVLYMFRIICKETDSHMALVIPFDARLRASDQYPNRDKELRLTRVCPRPRGSSMFIETNRIVRGALLAEDPSSPVAERLVVNFIDQDMWMRLKTIKLIPNANM